MLIQLKVEILYEGRVLPANDIVLVDPDTGQRLCAADHAYEIANETSPIDDLVWGYIELFTDMLHTGELTAYGIADALVEHFGEEHTDEVYEFLKILYERLVKWRWQRKQQGEQ